MKLGDKNMLHKLIADYLADIEKTMSALDNVYVEQYREEIFDRSHAPAWECRPNRSCGSRRGASV